MGNYWEPIDQEPAAESSTANYGFVASQIDADAAAMGDEAPVHLQGFDEATSQPVRQGGDVSQYGGPGRPTGSGDFGSGGDGGGDDDRFTQPFAEQGGQDPYEPEHSPFGYQEEERYWTDYLRIAAPVVGVIIMLGLVWIWIGNLVGGDDENGDNGDQDLSGPVIDADTPGETAESEDESEGDEPVTVTTPEENGDTAGEGDGDGTATSIGPGATVVIAGTGESGLNVRSSASTDAEVVTSLADGTALTITGESEPGEGFTWWPIEGDGVTGFVVEDFIELSE